MDLFSGIKDWFGSKPQWNPQLAKTHLKLAMSRIKLQMNKKQNSNSVLKREAAQLLREGKEAQAKLSVENLFRQENINKALSQLEVICEHVLARFDALNMTSHPPPDLHGALCSIIFAGPRVDIQELRQIAQNFELKYGKEFVQEAMSNKYNTVHEKILETLSMARPKQAIIDGLLFEIAQENKVDWAPDDLDAAYAALKQLRPEANQPDDQDNDEIPDEIPEPALDDNDLPSDQDLWKEFESEQQKKNQPDLMLVDDDDEIPDDIPAPNFGAPAKHPQPSSNFSSNFHFSQTASSNSTARSTSPASAASGNFKPSAAPTSHKPAPIQQESDDFDLDLPEVPVSPPKPHFSGGDDGNSGGDLDDLDNLLPQVPPTDPHNHIASKSTNFGAGSGFGSSMASMARKPSPGGSAAAKPAKPSNINSASSPQSNSSSGALDDDDLMARFRRLRDSN